MIVEKPVIASGIDSVPNAVGDSCAGLLILADGVRITADSLERLIPGPGIRSKYGEARAMKVSSEVWAQKDFEKLIELWIAWMIVGRYREVS